MRKTSIIVAGGRGTRMGAEIPKQFLELDGYPILMQTIRIFQLFNPDGIRILVLPKDQMQTWINLCLQHGFDGGGCIRVAGGDNRFESVKNGLAKAPDEGLIGIHDGVRPFIHVETIRRIYQEAAQLGNAIPGLAPSESVRVVEDEGSSILDRSRVRLIQTPQVFEARMLKKAYEQAYTDRFTDDASVVEAAGYPIHLVEGQAGNIKITTPEDLTAK